MFDIILVEKTILGAVRGLFTSKKFLATLGGFFTNALVWVLSFAVMHFKDRLHLSDKVVEQIPTFALELSGCIVVGLSVFVNAMGNQDVALANNQPVTVDALKTAFQAGVDAAHEKIKADLPKLVLEAMQPSVVDKIITVTSNSTSPL